MIIIIIEKLNKNNKKLKIKNNNISRVKKKKAS
jgi:hypothetical protein